MFVCWSFQGNHNHLMGQQIRPVAPNQQYSSMQPTQASSGAFTALGTFAVLIVQHSLKPRDNNPVVSCFSLQNISQGYTPYGPHMGTHPSQAAGIVSNSYNNQGFGGGHPGPNPGMVDSLRQMQQRPSGYVHQQASGAYGHTMQNTQRSVTDLFKILWLGLSTSPKIIRIGIINHHKLSVLPYLFSNILPHNPNWKQCKTNQLIFHHLSQILPSAHAAGAYDARPGSRSHGTAGHAPQHEAQSDDGPAAAATTTSPAATTADDKTASSSPSAYMYTPRVDHIVGMHRYHFFQNEADTDAFICGTRHYRYQYQYLYFTAFVIFKYIRQRNRKKI